MSNPPTNKPNPLSDAEPDMVDRLFDYIFAECPEFAAALVASRVPEIKIAMRAEFAGDRQRISARTPAGRRDTMEQILAQFNGRNATEVARRLRVSRATVYRMIKQAGTGAITNSLKPGRNETAEPVASGIPPNAPTPTQHALQPWPTPKPTLTPSNPPLPAEK